MHHFDRILDASNEAAVSCVSLKWVMFHLTNTSFRGLTVLKAAILLVVYCLMNGQRFKVYKVLVKEGKMY